jgi:hypothetical protein
MAIAPGTVIGIEKPTAIGQVAFGGMTEFQVGRF